jgi:hypothetical protein
MLPGRGRPQPPPGLSLLERRIWTDVCDSLPDGWLDLSGQLILRRLEVQCAIAEVKEARIRRLIELDTPSALEDVTALASDHSDTAKSIAYLLTQLRATPRSRLVSRAAGFDFNSASVDRAERPWEVRAKELPQ